MGNDRHYFEVQKDCWDTLENIQRRAIEVREERDDALGKVKDLEFRIAAQKESLNEQRARIDKSWVRDADNARKIAYLEHKLTASESKLAAMERERDERTAQRENWKQIAANVGKDCTKLRAQVAEARKMHARAAYERDQMKMYRGMELSAATSRAESAEAALAKWRSLAARAVDYTEHCGQCPRNFDSSRPCNCGRDALDQEIADALSPERQGTQNTREPQERAGPIGLGVDAQTPAAGSAGSSPAPSPSTALARLIEAADALCLALWKDANAVPGSMGKQWAALQAAVVFARSLRVVEVEKLRALPTRSISWGWGTKPFVSLDDIEKLIAAASAAKETE